MINDSSIDFDRDVSCIMEKCDYVDVVYDRSPGCCCLEIVIAPPEAMGKQQQ